MLQILADKLCAERNDFESVQGYKYFYVMCLVDASLKEDLGTGVPKNRTDVFDHVRKWESYPGPKKEQIVRDFFERLPIKVSATLNLGGAGKADRPALRGPVGKAVDIIADGFLNFDKPGRVLDQLCKNGDLTFVQDLAASIQGDSGLRVHARSALQQATAKLGKKAAIPLYQSIDLIVDNVALWDLNQLLMQATGETEVVIEVIERNEQIVYKKNAISQRPLDAKRGNQVRMSQEDELMYNKKYTRLVWEKKLKQLELLP